MHEIGWPFQVQIIALSEIEAAVALTSMRSVFQTMERSLMPTSAKEATFASTFLQPSSSVSCPPTQQPIQALTSYAACS